MARATIRSVRIELCKWTGFADFVETRFCATRRRFTGYERASRRPAALCLENVSLRAAPDAACSDANCPDAATASAEQLGVEYSFVLCNPGFAVVGELMKER